MDEEILMSMGTERDIQHNIRNYKKNRIQSERKKGSGKSEEREMQRKESARVLETYVNFDSALSKIKLACVLI